MQLTTDKLKKIARKSLQYLRNTLLVLFALSLSLVIAGKYIPVYLPVNVFTARVKSLFSEESFPVKHKWVSLSGMPIEVVQAVIASEDNLFLLHNGFSVGGQEVNPNLPLRERYRSNKGTISQQTARNVFLLPGENILNDLLETYFTLLIEFVWGKERIMEVYLNSVQTGKGLYGVEAASQHYYAKEEVVDTSEACGLTKEEAAMIAVVITDPEETDPLNPTAYMLRYQAKIIRLIDKLIPIEF